YYFDMKSTTATKRIEDKIFELLENNPEGVHWSELKLRIKESDATLHPKTINGVIWKLSQKYPERVYKPSKGVFRLLKYSEDK
ncbi:MAG: hypothetical protein HY779_01240, partial [Rubrobacteridae bacterium]|nr:hypothetical protein [Rubrobacteridae bacterium]